MLHSHDICAPCAVCSLRVLRTVLKNEEGDACNATVRIDFKSLKERSNASC